MSLGLDMIQLETGFSFGGVLDPSLPHSYPLGSDAYWMREALLTARLGVGIANPNPSVGCVIVDVQGREVARGATQAFGGKHAERIALEKVNDPRRLENGTLYVTLEPCSHFGHQPPCVQEILTSKLRRIVVAHSDPNPLVRGEGIRQLQAAGKEVQIGPLSAEAIAWNFPFLAAQIFRRPILALKWAQTLDGQLTDDQGHSQWITGPTARAYTHWLRQKYDAILVGARTVLTDFPLLSVRDCGPPHQTQPLPIIFDPHGICLEVNRRTQAQLLEKTFSPTRPLVYLTTGLPSRKSSKTRARAKSWLEKRSHVTFMPIPKLSVLKTVSFLKDPLLEQLLTRPLQSIMIEGGPRTLTSFLQAGLGDVIHLFTAPLFTGGHRHRIQLELSLQKAKRFELIATARRESDLVLEMISQDAYSQIFESLLRKTQT